MKICFLAGANSSHSYKWVKYFADKGHQVHWISFKPNTQEKINGVSFYKITPPFPFNFFELKKIVKKIKPDIFHAHYAGVNGFVASLLNFHPFVLTVWGSDVLIAGKNFIKKFFVKYALKKSDLITCDAFHMKETMIKMGIREDKIKIIYFGVDVKKFFPDLAGQKDGNKVISLRSFEPIYNIETLIKAIPLVVKEIPDVKFVLAGRGSEEENLKNLAKELGVLKQTEFVGLISQDNLPKYLKESSVYVSTSLSDAGLASSTAEAMACGLPVIITDFGNNKDWVKDGESGFLIPLKDYKFLAEKIIYLLKNSEERLKLANNARIVIEGKNNYYVEMLKMENFYLSLLENAPITNN
jgi:glycosyltransferase involved in cell wall biosynthesis